MTHDPTRIAPYDDDGSLRGKRLTVKGWATRRATEKFLGFA